MAFNIMDLVKEQLTPGNIGALAGLVGEDEKKTASGLSGAMPALLGGLLGSLSKPEGQSAFNAAVDKADPGILGNLAGALSGEGGKSLIASGLGMLASLFGGSKLGLLASAIAAFSGLSSGSSKSLLGIAAPLLLGLLSKKKKSDGLDSGGLIEMLRGQKDNIAKAMPPKLGSELSGSGIFDDLLGKAGAAATAATSAAAGTARATADTAQHAARQGKSLFGKLLPLLILAVVAWFVYQFLFATKPVEEKVKQVGSAAVGALTVDNIDLGKEVTGLFENAVKVLGGITDVESARKALTGLGDINKKLDGISGLVGKLPAQGRQMLVDMIGKLSPGLDKAIKTAYAIPGVSDVLGDSVNSLLKKLSALSKS